MNIGAYAALMTVLGLLAMTSLLGSIVVLRPVKANALLWQFRPRCLRELSAGDRKRVSRFYMCIACWFVSGVALSLLAMKLSGMI
jgi:hypothetical protein